MNNNTLKEAAELFNTTEKWNAFVELVNQQDNLKNMWWNELQENVYNRGTAPDWTVYKYHGIEKIIWYVSDAQQGQSSTSIYFDGEHICIYFYSGVNPEEAQKLIEKNKERFQIIFDQFDNVEKGGKYLLWEKFKFRDGNKDILGADKLAWYAGNRTEEFANQLVERIQKLQTTEITNLFREINENCK
ncbi:hypothetical protein [Capnocytophaga stomatis]|uniref:DUF4268 domain-containing protein n=1 Tax=Capnocytophaga stomatis TaxID=1848904 RepID=A0ABW8Q8J9_9FLAO|nr:hypothetical protein [Capnocytophaga stomatis]GIJ93193.1 hypothetical protein CAPN002_04110 [Capnocytophaga stomatis]GIM50376.1 hypothetical protein CAPN003_18280 [Capnocytophaga stomatis]